MAPVAPQVPDKVGSLEISLWVSVEFQDIDDE